MNAKKRSRLLLALTGLFIIALLVTQPSNAGTPCQGYDDGGVYYCDGVGSKICFSITMNGETRVCHGVKRTEIGPVVN